MLESCKFSIQQGKEYIFEMKLDKFQQDSFEHKHHYWDNSLVYKPYKKSKYFQYSWGKWNYKEDICFGKSPYSNLLGKLTRTCHPKEYKVLHIEDN